MALDLKRTILLLVLAICIVFSVFLAITLATQNLNHACCKTEESGCLPCLQIETAKNFFRVLKLAIFFMLFAAHRLLHALAPEKRAENIVYRFSPIALKVRFNS
jgi:hypothetical protein